MTDRPPADAPSEELARTAIGAELENLLHARAEAVLLALLENPALREPQLLVMLSRRDLAPTVITAISRNAGWMRSYPLKAAVLKHPLTPRHIALPLLKHIYLFDLLSVALTPGLSADLKRMAEDSILSQLPGIALGQKLSLARRGSHRIAAGLLLAPEAQVVAAALENPAMTDTALAQALASGKAAPALTRIIWESRNWMTRRPVLLGIMRSQYLTLAQFATLLPGLNQIELADLKQDPRLPRNLRDYVDRYAAGRRRPATADDPPAPAP